MKKLRAPYPKFGEEVENSEGSEEEEGNKEYNDGKVAGIGDAMLN